METCKNCGKPLDYIDVGLTKKLMGRGLTEFMCKSCLSKHFGVTEKLLDEKVEQFKAMGCTLFIK